MGSLIVMTSLESRADVESLAELHHQRRQLLEQLAPLKALHGHNGLWDDKRKQYLEAQKIDARINLGAMGSKVTDATVEAEAYGSKAYEEFLDNGLAARVEYIRLANELTEIEERIENRITCLNAYNAETRLR